MLALVVAHGASATPVALRCPDRYPDKPALRELRQQGWHATDDTQQRSRLVEAGVLVGLVSENGELRGADLPHGTGREFHFAGTADDGQMWFYCSYGARAEPRLAFQLPTSASRCETVERLVRRQLVEASIQCQ